MWTCVSTGDDAGVKYECSLSGVQDATYVVLFKNIFGAKPKAILNVGVGETQSKSLEGICSRPENGDEFYLNCAFVDGFDLYHVTMQSVGSPGYISTVTKIGSGNESSLLGCYLIEQ